MATFRSLCLHCSSTVSVTSSLTYSTMLLYLYLFKIIQLHATASELPSGTPTNFNGSPLRFGTFENPPHVMFEWNAQGSLVGLQGIDGQLANTLARQLNFSLQVVTPAKGEHWGALGKDGSHTGLLGMIADGSVDFGAGSLGISVEYCAVMSTSASHYSSYVVLGVPAGRPYTAFEKLFLPFSKLLWFAVIGTVMFALVTIGAVNRTSDTIKRFIYGRRAASPVLDLVNLLVGGALHETPRGTFAQTLLYFWLILTLTIRTAYQGSLFKYLQTPMNYPSPSTFTQIDESGLPYYATNIRTDLYDNSPNIRARLHIYPQYLYEQQIRRLGGNELDGVLLVLKEDVAYHNKFSSREEFIQIAQEQLSGFPLAFFYPKNSILVAAFDQYIHRIVASGLVQYWATQYGDYEFFRQKSVDTELKAFTVDNLLGAIQILVMLEVASVGIFLLEWVSQWSAVLRKVVNWMQ